MRKLLQTILASLLFAAGISCVPSQAANTIHVSPAGSDRNSGAADAPLATFEAARDLIRKVRKRSKAWQGKSIIVLVQPGTYPLANTLELGAMEHTTIWKAAKPDTVFITGGSNFSAQDASPLTAAEKERIITTEARDKILRIDLKKAGVTCDLGTISQRGFAKAYRPLQAEISIDGKILDLARWPNKGEKHIPITKVIDTGSIPRNGDYSDRGGIIQYGAERVGQWSNAQDAWIYGYFAHGYSDDSVKIKKIDPDKNVLETVQPSRYGFMSGKSWRAFFGFNLFEEIDQPGEYYIDREARVLYFYPPSGFDPQTSTLSISELSTPMVAIENTKNVTLEGFTFENTRGMGIYMEESLQCVVDSCILRNIGLLAVVIGNGVEPGEGSLNEFHNSILKRKATPRILGSINERIYADTAFERRGGSGNAIVNCHIYDIGCGGLHIGGGSFKTLTPSKNRVENCHIHHVNRVEKTYRSAVNLDGVGQIVRNNLIEDTLQSAIYFHGNDHLIEYNEFNRCLTYGDDMGVIYYGRNPSELGTTIRYNYFQNCGRGHTSNTPVIYADDGACNITVHGNVFFRSGSAFTFLLGGGSFHEIYNNAFVECAPAIRIGNRLQTWSKSLLKKGGMFETRLEAIEGSAFSKRYPFMDDYLKNNPAAPKDNLFKNNILQNTADGGNKKFIVFSDNFNSSENVGFKDSIQNNKPLILSADALKVLGPDFESPPVEKMGIQPVQAGEKQRGK